MSNQRKHSSTFEQRLHNNSIQYKEIPKIFEAPCSPEHQVNAFLPAKYTISRLELIRI